MPIVFEDLEKYGFFVNRYGEMELQKEEIHNGIRRIVVTEMGWVYIEHCYGIPFNEDENSSILCANCGTMEQLISLCDIVLGMNIAS